jgi:hypothetical protein
MSELTSWYHAIEYSWQADSDWRVEETRGKGLFVEYPPALQVPAATRRRGRPLPIPPGG